MMLEVPQVWQEGLYQATAIIGQALDSADIAVAIVTNSRCCFVRQKREVKLA